MSETLTWDILARDRMSDVLDKLALVAGRLDKVLGQLGNQGVEAGGKLEVAQKGADTLGDELDALARKADESGLELDTLARRADSAGDELGQLARKVDEAGDQMRGTARDAGVLDAALAATKLQVRALAAEFDRTGDKSILKQSAAARRELSTLEKMRKELFDGDGGSGSSPLPNLVKPEAAGALAGSGNAIVAGIGVLGAPIGMIVAAAVLGGVGVGGIIGGAALAARDPRVGAAFAPLGRHVMESLSADAAVFVDPLTLAANKFEAAWDSAINPNIATSLADLSSKLDPLVDGFDGFAANTMAGLREAVKGALPVLDVLAHELPSIGAAVADFFESLRDAGPGAAQAFSFALKILEKTIVGVGNVLEFWSKGFAFWAGLVTGTVHKLRELDDATHGALQEALGFSGGIQRVDDSMQDWQKSLDAAPPSLGVVSNETDKLAQSARELADATELELDMFDQVMGRLMDVDSSTDAYATSLLNLRDSIDQNGTALDLNSRKGLANRDALLASVQAADRLRQANFNSGMSAQDAGKIFATQVDQIRAVATQMGLTAAEVDKLIGRYKAIPSEVVTTVTTRKRMIDLGIDPDNPNSMDERYTRTGYADHGTDEAYYRQRDGGIIHAASGLVTNAGIYGQSAAPLVHFAEPGTGDEGFLPRLGIPRGRGLDLLAKMGDWYDAKIVPREQLAALAGNGRAPTGGGAWPGESGPASAYRQGGAAGSGGGDEQTVRIVLEYPNGEHVRTVLLKLAKGRAYRTVAQLLPVGPAT